MYFPPASQSVLAMPPTPPEFCSSGCADVQCHDEDSAVGEEPPKSTAFGLGTLDEVMPLLDGRTRREPSVIDAA
jgi:hypothetical protein